MQTTESAGGLKSETIGILTDIFSEFPEISEVTLFGSRAKGNYREGSDIDITLKGENLSATTLIRLHNRIEDYLFPWIFDILIYDRISNAELISHINRVGITIYRRSDSSQKDKMAVKV